MDGQELTSKPLPSIRQWMDWELLGVLPKGGGTLDQDPEFMRDIRFILNTKTSLEKHKQEMEKIKQEIKKKTGQ